MKNFLIRRLAVINIIKLTKGLMSRYIDDLISEVQSFQYQDWTKENYLKDLPNKWEYSIISLSNREIGGFSINSEKNDVFYIHFFYIFQKYRNSKLGSKMIEYCIRTAKEQKKRSVSLKCHRDNVGAINFYFKNKFYILEIDPKNNLYLMERRIY